MSSTKDQHTVGQFVLRARRVEAHSLVRDWDTLVQHARGSFHLQVDISGSARITRELPASEEIFESLAARVRPVTLDKEPIHHKKVLKALGRLLDDSESCQETDRVIYDQLCSAWAGIDLQGSAIRGYAVQSASIDGSGSSPMVSDTQLAAGWMYADLVHSDPSGAKKDSLLFPLRERYAAGVRYFAQIAILIVRTLQFIDALRKAEKVSITDRAWEQEVVVGVTELVEEARALFASAGTPMPDLGDVDFGLSDAWKPITVTDLLREDPTNRVTVVLRRQDASVVAQYDAAVARRAREGDRIHWHILIAGCVIIPFELRVQGESVTEPLIGEWIEFNSNNRLLLALNGLWMDMNEAETMVFEVGGEPFITLTPPTFKPDDYKRLRVQGETLADLVQIELLSGQELGPCVNTYTDRERVWLRIARLSWEGKIAEAVRGPVKATSRTGNPPAVIILPAHSVDVGGADVPIRTLAMRHPDMTPAKDPEPQPDGSSRYEMTLPAEQRLAAWCPELRQVNGDVDLSQPVTWDLVDINPATFPL